MFNFKYFKWLQKDVPVGEVENFPLLTGKNETTLRGCYIAGDLTGVPLLKMAAESGASLVRQFCYEKDFNERIGKDKNIYDIIIIGAGPAGVSAAIECQKRKLHYLILEANNPFTTIENFPA
jgi:NosR/NirI family transcriptional regulator, nitrous oxide reductase regulator